MKRGLRHPSSDLSTPNAFAISPAAYHPMNSLAAHFRTLVTPISHLVSPSCEREYTWLSSSNRTGILLSASASGRRVTGSLMISSPCPFGLAVEPILQIGVRHELLIHAAAVARGEAVLEPGRPQTVLQVLSHRRAVGVEGEPHPDHRDPMALLQRPQDVGGGQQERVSHASSPVERTA